jgi:hypothetical protein
MGIVYYISGGERDFVKKSLRFKNAGLGDNYRLGS